MIKVGHAGIANSSINAHILSRARMDLERNMIVYTLSPGIQRSLGAEDNALSPCPQALKLDVAVFERYLKLPKVQFRVEHGKVSPVMRMNVTGSICPGFIATGGKWEGNANCTSQAAFHCQVFLDLQR